MLGTRHAFERRIRWHKIDQGEDLTSKVIMKQFIICDSDV
jgi:hypothetical protein